MIIIRLMGGLGNQLFQYALGRHLSLINKTDLKFDMTYYETSTSREYRLNNFNIKESFATSKEINAVKNNNFNFFKKVFNKLTPYPYKRLYIQEKYVQFDPDILKSPKNIYLDGYWNSDKYFSDIRNTIQLDLEIKRIPDKDNQFFAKLIREKDFSVSIHFRRGDYVNNPTINEFHGICPLDYYYKSLDLLNKIIKKPHFFIFSDDPDWVKKNFNVDYECTFIEHNGVEKDYEDLRLMSLCKNHIIANSSFSWWGAWLCQYDKKIVIAPKKWFNNLNINTNDLIPLDWKRI